MGSLVEVSGVLGGKRGWKKVGVVAALRAMRSFRLEAAEGVAAAERKRRLR